MFLFCTTQQQNHRQLKQHANTNLIITLLSMGYGGRRPSPSPSPSACWSCGIIVKKDNTSTVLQRMGNQRSSTCPGDDGYGGDDDCLPAKGLAQFRCLPNPEHIQRCCLSTRQLFLYSYFFASPDSKPGPAGIARRNVLPEEDGFACFLL